MKKRLLGILVVLVMVIGLLPATAFAADCENHAEDCIEAVQELVDALPDMTETELEPNGDGEYFYLPEGKYAVLEEVEGEWDKTLFVNGEEEDAFKGTAGRAYRVMLANAWTPPEEILYYPVWIGDMQLTSKNAKDVFEDGKVSYDADTNTLTLKNFSYTATEYNHAIRANSDLNLVLVGENSLTANGGNGIHLNMLGDLTVGGDGSLAIKADGTGIYTGTESNVIINSGNIKIESGYYGIYASQTEGATDGSQITINGGNIEVHALGRGIEARYIKMNDGNAAINGSHTKVSVTVSQSGNAGKYYAIYGKAGVEVADNMTVTKMGDYGDILDEDDYGFYAKEVIIEVEEADMPAPAKKTKKYDSVIKQTENGKVKVDDDYAKRGQEITITVTPDKGYELDELTIIDQYDDEVDYEKGKKENIYVFDMPKSDVTIEASFEKVDDAEEPEEEPEKEEPEAPAVQGEKEIILTIGSRIIMVDGESIVNDVAPVIKDGRTFLPIRFIAETLGASVVWNEAEQAVTITKDALVIVIYIGQPFAMVNGEPVELDVPAFIDADRTFLPIRFIAENLGAEVVWNDAAGAVTICSAE